MNSKKYLTLAAFITIFLSLSGCAAEPGNPATKETQETAKPAISMADTTALAGAIEQQDESLCGKITDQPTQKNCKLQIENTSIVNEALKAMDPTLCDKITIKETADDCRMKIEVAKSAAVKKQEEEKALAADLASRDEIVKSGNIADCKNLKEENNRTDCELNILANKAMQAKDPSICDQGSTDTIKKTCRDMASATVVDAKIGE
jgi:hypothetical protein